MQVLNVDWGWVTAAQLLLLCIFAYVASAAIIKYPSHLATAQLLRPVVGKLHGHGCASSGADIAHHIENTPIVYGVRHPVQSSDDAVYHFDVIEQSESIETNPGTGWKPRTNMPKGWYDGA
jgi:hypothetical protein